jgi:hypothetical protein
MITQCAWQFGGIRTILGIKMRCSKLLVRYEVRDITCMHFVQSKVLSGHLDAVPGPFRTRRRRSRTCCYRAMKIEVSFVQAKTLMKLVILLTSYLLQDNILVLQHTIWPNSLKYLLCWDYLQQIIYHELKVDKWNK